MTIRYIISEWFCMFVFFVAGSGCLYEALVDFSTDNLAGFLFLFLGGITLIAISLHGTIKVFRKVRNRD